MSLSLFRKTAGIALVLSLVIVPSLSAQAPINLGNLVVVRVGTGAATLNSNATAAFLDEITTAGAPVQTIAMPVAPAGANKMCTISGSSTSEGFLNQSGNGAYLMLAGYDAAPATVNVAASATTGGGAVVRVVGRVDIGTGTVDTSTSTTSYSAGNIRSATSLTGADFYASGTASALGGMQYFASLGATSSTMLTPTPTNCRVAQIFLGQLMTSTASGLFIGLNSVGTGLPTTSGQPTTNLPGTSTSGTGTPSPYDYFFADPNTVYVADDRSVANGGGIQKWTFNGTTWSVAYTLAVHATLGARGVTGTVAGGTTVLYATSAGSTAAGINTLVTVTDAGVGSPFTLLATSGANTAFRGVRLVKPGPQVGSFGVGCPGTGALVPTMAANSLPYLGNGGYGMNIANAAASAPAYLYGSIGYNLTGFTYGIATCTVYLDVPTALNLIAAAIFPIPGGTDGSGNGFIGLPLPYAPFLAGIPVGLQTLVYDAGAPDGFVLTNAVGMILELAP